MTTIDKGLVIKCLKLGLPAMLSAVFNIVINFGDKFFLRSMSGIRPYPSITLAFPVPASYRCYPSPAECLATFIFQREGPDKEPRENQENGVASCLDPGGTVGCHPGGCYRLFASRVSFRSYRLIVYVLPLLLAGQIVICLVFLYSNYLVYFEKTSLILWSGLAVSAVSTLLNMTLIPRWEIFGAAATLLVSNGCYLVIYYFIITHYTKTFAFQSDRLKITLFSYRNMTLKKALSTYISRMRGESFIIDDRVPSGYLLEVVFSRIVMKLRGRLIFMRGGPYPFIGGRVTIRCRAMISFGKRVSIGNHVYIDALSSEGIRLGNNVSVGKATKIECTGSLRTLGKGLEVGDNVGLGTDNFYGCAGGIRIGQDTIVGNFVSFHAENHNYSRTDVPIRSRVLHTKAYW